MPHMALYEGKTDPDNHIEIYIGHMNLYGIPKAIQFRAFRTTLAGAAIRLFKRLPANSISCWNDLSKVFQSQFIGVHELPMPTETPVVMHQDPNESLKDWLHRYTTEVASMEDLTEREVLMGALSSMRHDILFREDLNRKSPYSYQEFLKRTKRFINAEETGRLARNEASEVNNPPN
ncbi:hypothetical protein TIFTF001_017340 [Ficus carica]|uniref:Retrotransposon gag domain-containing protein n=1 Tax=Ficus carica TaxID=3494 RepID=A0AA88A919_FICCA|nr:hypothetical protein TIFTF001_017340 [Ficus carica]